MTTIPQLLDSEPFRARLAGLARFQAAGYDPDDISQQITLRLLTHRHKLDGQTPGYSVRYASWQCRNIVAGEGLERQRVYEEPVYTDDDGDEIAIFDELIALPGPSPEQIVERREWLVELDRTLATLTPRQRQVAYLLAEGYKQTEIADRLHISPNGVRKTVRRMRLALAA